VPGVALLLLIASIFPMRMAARGVRDDQASMLKNGLLLTVLLGAAYVGVNIFSYFGLGFDHKSEAFGSIFYSLAIYQMLVAVIGVAMLAVTLFWFMRISGRGVEGRAYRQSSVPNLGFYWYYSIGAGIVTYAFLYLGPILI
jgi:cytochrome c oxidase subunit 3